MNKNDESRKDREKWERDKRNSIPNPNYSSRHGWKKGEGRVPHVHPLPGLIR